MQDHDIKIYTPRPTDSRTTGDDSADVKIYSPAAEHSAHTP